jgi:hypothetical protein
MCRDEGIFADWANVYFEQFMKITQVAQNAQGKKLPFMKLLQYLLLAILITMFG